MTNPNKHINDKELFSNIEIPYSKSKEDIWENLLGKIEEGQEKTRVDIKPKKIIVIWFAAASIVVLIGITAFMRLYTVNLYAPNGQHLSSNLPDGSMVQLNAQTSLTFKPYWWRFSRELRLEGEAFFDVKKGKTFNVVSEQGNTKVLGTTFNIFARKELYKVHCFTGKVQVESEKGEREVLYPKEFVEISNKKILKVREDEHFEESVSWIDNKFFFTGVPLKKVFEELERQFDVAIEFNNIISEKYTGNFKRGSSADELLDIICKPFGLNYKKTSTGTYVIQKK